MFLFSLKTKKLNDNHHDSNRRVIKIIQVFQHDLSSCCNTKHIKNSFATDRSAGGIWIQF